LEISDFIGGDKHVEYIVKVRGRTKYLVNLGDLAENGLITQDQIVQIEIPGAEAEEGQKTQVVEYSIVKRYSELLMFNKLLQSEMKNYMKKKGFNPEDFPPFPPKKLFNKSKNFIQKRIFQINTYFE
jgi:hypothetical protein